MRASELDPKQQEFQEMFGKFLEIAIDVLKLDSLPEFHFEAFLDHPQQPTFGMYVNGENKLYVGLSGRHPNDIFRTIAHELTHYKQDTEHMLDDRSGETGSPIENQANAMAGIIMRHFNKTYPDYLRSKPVMEDIDSTDESLKGLAAAGLIGLGMLGGPKDVASGNLPQDLQKAQQQHRVQMAKKPMAKPQAAKPAAVKPLPAKATPLLKVAKANGIKGIELAQFLAQMEHESLDFKKMKELGKSTYFNKYDPKHNPKLATKLGNKFKGDGLQFRGRGFIQLTGRENYTQASRDIFGDDRLVKKPDLAAQPDIAARIAVWYWTDRVKPLVKDFSDTTRVTKIINGGLNGLEDRENNFRDYMASLGLMEKWSMKYKKSINCANPKGFSQRAHCQGRKKNLQELGTTQYKVTEPRDMVNVDFRTKQITYKVFKFKVDKQVFLIVLTVKDQAMPGSKKKVPTLNVAFGRQDKNGWDVDDIDTNLTGDNQNQFQIYSTVIKAIQKFITQLNPNVAQIIIKGDNERQQVMYDRFFNSRYLEKFFPGWQLNPTTKTLIKNQSQNLKELLDPKLAVDLEWAEGSDYIAARGYVTVTDQYGNKEDEELEVEFLDYPHPQRKEYEVQFKVGDSYAITGGGNANVIFASVIQACKDFVEIYKPDRLFFTADEQSRARAYDTITKRVAKEVGWHVIPFDEIQKDSLYRNKSSNGFVFVISKGTAPEKWSSDQEPQHGSFMPIWYVYNLDKDTPTVAVKVRAPDRVAAVTHARKIEPSFKDLDSMQIHALSSLPKREVTDVIDGGTAGEEKKVKESNGQQLTVQQLANISDEALDKAYGYGRSTPGNSFGWQANLMSAAYAKKMIDSGITDIEQISDAIHKGWNVTAQKFVQDPDQFSDTEKLRQAGKLEAKLQQRAKLMKINYAQLDDDEQEKDRVVARALLQAITGEQGIDENFADGKNPEDKGDSGRHGIKKGITISQLKKIRSSDSASPRKKQLAHWQINMRQGRSKKG